MLNKTDCPHSAVRIASNIGLLVLAGVVGGLLVLALTGCAGLPLEGSEPVQLPYYLPGTDMQLFTASPAGEPGPATDWITLGVKILGAVTGTSGLLSLASPNGRKAWSKVGDPQAGIVESVKALGNVATFGYVPPPASIKPDRTEP